MKPATSFFLLIGITLISITPSLTAQEYLPFSKAAIYQRLQQKVQRKADLQSAFLLPLPTAPVPEVRNGADANVSQTPGAPESEMHAAVNPQDTNNIIVSSMQYTNEATQPLAVRTYYTFDGGPRWGI